MSKLANHIALFCSHDKITLIHSSDLFVRDVISNRPIRTGLDFKSSHFDPVLAASASDCINLRGLCADLKSSPVIIVGFEKLRNYKLWRNYDNYLHE
jgi:hypothetical protein